MSPTASLLSSVIPFLYTKLLPINFLLIKAAKKYRTHVCKLSLNHKQKPYFTPTVYEKENQDKYESKLSLQGLS